MGDSKLENQVKEITEAFLPFCEVIRKYPRAINVSFVHILNSYNLVIDRDVLNGKEPNELNHKMVCTDPLMEENIKEL